MVKIFIAIIFIQMAHANFPWWIKNQGQSLFRESSDLNREEIKGIVGKDINWIDTDLWDAKEKEVVVAVIDSGIDINHPNLKNKIVEGRNVIYKNQDVTDDDGHGTHVAGLIAAEKSSDAGDVMGAADRRIKIMPIKFYSTNSEEQEKEKLSDSDFMINGKLVTSLIAEGINWAVAHGAKVINLSLGWPSMINGPDIIDAIQNADKNGVLIISGAGNNSKELPVYPCSFSSVICVGSIDNQGIISRFSNRGPMADLVAPGESMVSTYPLNVESSNLRMVRFERLRGTSQSTPLVSALVANLKLFHPEWSNDEIKRAVFETARPIEGALYGAVNYKDALTLNLKNHDQIWVGVNFKSLQTQTIPIGMKDKLVEINIPLKNYSHTSGWINFEYQGKIQLVYLKAHENKIITINKKLDTSLANTDHRLPVEIFIEGRKFNLIYYGVRKLEGEIIKYPLDINLNNTVAFPFQSSKLRAMTRIKTIIDVLSEKSMSEYYWQIKNELNFLLYDGTDGEFKYQHLIFKLDASEKIILIQHANKNFLVVSTLENNQIFTLINSQMEVIYRQSISLNNFSGFSSRNGFSLFNKNNELVPYLMMKTKLPEIDNSTNINERDFVENFHVVYLDLKSHSWRVLDNHNFLAKLKEKLKLYDDQQLQLIDFNGVDFIYKLTSKAEDLNALIKVDSNFKVKYFDIPIYYLEGTKIKIDDANLFFAMLTSKNQLQGLFLNQKNGIYHEVEAKTFNNDAIINIANAMMINDQPSLLLETRSNLVFLNGLNAPMNRESSFPQAMTKELYKVWLDNKKNVRVFMDSMMLSSDRLYVMKYDGQRFISPISESFQFPEGCAFLSAIPNKISFLCPSSQNSKLGASEIRIFPF